MKIIVTAGPTREPIDPVRFIGNRSSGKMGYAVAAAALRRGHSVVLISGPVAIAPPAGVKLRKVVTAREMLADVRSRLPWCDALVMTAAVADWRPAVCARMKIKKTGEGALLRLKPNPDILKAVAPRKGRRIFVGFAAETGRLRTEALRKLREKKLDMIVANDVGRPDSGFEAETNRVVLFSAGGEETQLPLMAKTKIAARIIKWIERRQSRGVMADNCACAERAESV
ncbi:MAG: phosphopantothenoylcysteine decarboxylase [Kiritimatiellae bacterium]|nr:phosphopantothenoylcysteine decarboxylase [Kiritimatiellia bacterium]